VLIATVIYKLRMTAGFLLKKKKKENNDLEPFLLDRFWQA
jgi:hypothetical protein